MDQRRRGILATITGAMLLVPSAGARAGETYIDSWSPARSIATHNSYPTYRIDNPEHQAVDFFATGNLARSDFPEYPMTDIGPNQFAFISGAGQAGSGNGVVAISQPGGQVYVSSDPKTTAWTKPSSPLAQSLPVFVRAATLDLNTIWLVRDTGEAWIHQSLGGHIIYQRIVSPPGASAFKDVAVAWQDPSKPAIFLDTNGHIWETHASQGAFSWSSPVGNTVFVAIGGPGGTADNHGAENCPAAIGADGAIWTRCTDTAYNRYLTPSAIAWSWTNHSTTGEFENLDGFVTNNVSQVAVGEDGIAILAIWSSVYSPNRGPNYSVYNFD